MYSPGTHRPSGATTTNQPWRIAGCMLSPLTRSAYAFGSEVCPSINPSPCPVGCCISSKKPSSPSLAVPTTGVGRVTFGRPASSAWFFVSSCPDMRREILHPVRRDTTARFFLLIFPVRFQFDTACSEMSHSAAMAPGVGAPGCAMASEKFLASKSCSGFGVVLSTG